MGKGLLIYPTRADPDEFAQLLQARVCLSLACGSSNFLFNRRCHSNEWAKLIIPRNESYTYSSVHLELHCNVTIRC